MLALTFIDLDLRTKPSGWARKLGRRSSINMAGDASRVKSFQDCCERKHPMARRHGWLGSFGKGRTNSPEEEPPRRLAIRVLNLLN